MPEQQWPPISTSYVVKGMGKTYPGGREVLKEIYLSFLPGAKVELDFAPEEADAA
jgi:hypothetical protein